MDAKGWGWRQASAQVLLVVTVFAVLVTPSTNPPDRRAVLTFEGYQATHFLPLREVGLDLCIVPVGDPQGAA